MNILIEKEEVKCDHHTDLINFDTYNYKCPKCGQFISKADFPMPQNNLKELEKEWEEKIKTEIRLKSNRTVIHGFNNLTREKIIEWIFQALRSAYETGKKRRLRSIRKN